MKTHPLAELFPLMDGAELSLLADDIKQHGQRAPITLLDGAILDGRNRFRACEIAEVEPKTRAFKEGDPLEFVLSANLHRRHLSESQRAMVAAKIATMQVGKPSKPANLPILKPSSRATSASEPGKRPAETAPKKAAATQVEAAKMLNVSPRLVRDAKVVTAHPIIAAEVASGEISVSAAAKQIRAKEAEKEVVRDATGYAIPKKLLPLWARRGEVEEALKAISRARCAVRDAAKDDDILYRPVSLNSIQSRLDMAYSELQVAVPYAVCCTCQGQTPDECTSCKGRGLISKHHYDRCVPEEMKAIRSKSCVL